MKKLLLLCSALFTVTTIQAKIWRVNNTGLPADFTTIQLAHDNASVVAGDTLHIEPSSVTYGNLIATKKLIIIGNGYFLNQNLNLQANPISSKINYFDFDAGSSGSVLMGLEILGTSTSTIRVSNISVCRNFFPSTAGTSYLALVKTPSPYTNILISQNFFNNGGITSTSTGTQAYSNIMILNNYITSINLGVYFSGSIMNNHIAVGTNIADYFVIKNNISSHSTGGTFSSTTGSTLTHNTSVSSSGFPAGNNNSNAIALSTLYTQSGSSDAYFTLKSGSPAIGTGDGGVDRGIFGGSNPYVLSGIPPVPSIYKLSAPTNSNGNQLNVIISTKTNN